MTHAIHFSTLEKIGLTSGEALLFELLVEKGRSKAIDLANASGLGRGNTYNVLNGLKEKGLLVVVEGKQQLYECVEPNRLKTLLDARLKEAALLKAEFESELGQLQSAFQLSIGRPTVELYEGIDGIETALFDTLKSGGDICAYVDVHAISGDLAAINDRYVAARRKKQIRKRLIVADTKDAREFFAGTDPDLTLVAFVPAFPSKFETALEIYDGNVLHLTLTAQKKIAVITRDPSIYKFHADMFEYLWESFYQPKPVG